VGAQGAIRSAMRSLTIVIARTRIGRALLDELVDTAMIRTRTISHRGMELDFAAPNRLTRFRIATFSTKEPETLAWIDAIPEGSVMWDVGANIGLYSCYAAKARSCRVIAFEPSVFNLELLARNVHLNHLTDRITIVPLPLCEHVVDSRLNMTTTQWGGALSSFGVEHGFDGNALNKVFEFRTIGLSGDEFVTKLGVPYPDYIKMDVDGIEHLILRGGGEVLKRVRSVQIEINEGFETQARESRRLLEATGLHLVSKSHSDLIASSRVFNHTFNQVWAR
jgi:FkbM family methyltransferase